LGRVVVAGQRPNRAKIHAKAVSDREIWLSGSSSSDESNGGWHVTIEVACRRRRKNKLDSALRLILARGGASGGGSVQFSWG
jgi:hypothetical protein